MTTCCGIFDWLARSVVCWTSHDNFESLSGVWRVRASGYTQRAAGGSEVSNKNAPGKTQLIDWYDVTRASNYDHEFCEANLRPFTEPVCRWGHDPVLWWFGMETIHAKETHEVGGSNVGVCATLTQATVWHSMCTVGLTGSRVWTLTSARWWWVWCGITCVAIITSMQTTILHHSISKKLPLTLCGTICNNLWWQCMIWFV